MNRDIDLEGNNDGYSGTFRWKSNKKLLSLPLLSINDNNNDDSITINYELGWMQYLISRDEYNHSKGLKVTTPLISIAQKDLSLIDCLSTPLSIVHIIQKLGIYNNNDTNKKKKVPITIICIGCSSKAEERILRETNCFMEILYYFQHVILVELILVGPEISETIERLQYIDGKGKSSTWIASLYKGTSIDFFRANPRYISQSTIVVGINCGYGNFDNPMPKRYNLLVEWLPDLFFLTGLKLPVIFTCANDYSDLFGELTVMIKILGAKFISMPQENPFSFASTFIAEEGSHTENDYSRGNSYYYAIQCHDINRRFRVQKGQYTDIVNELQKLIGMKKVVDVCPYLTKIQFEWPNIEIDNNDIQSVFHDMKIDEKLLPDSIDNNVDINHSNSTKANNVGIDHSNSTKANDNSSTNNTNDSTKANDNNNTNDNTIDNSSGNTNDNNNTNDNIIDNSSGNTNDNNNINDNIIDNSSGNTNDNKANNVIQRIENNNIVICIPASNNNIDVSVSNDGLTLVVEMNDSSTKQFIQLVQKVDPSSMIAKYSKKKSIITITAQTNNNNKN